jgi:hypothetical protein
MRQTTSIECGAEHTKAEPAGIETNSTGRCWNIRRCLPNNDSEDGLEDDDASATHLTLIQLVPRKN